MTVILNSLKCEKPNCENPAIARYGKHWVCGEHLVQINAKIQKMREDVFFTEDG